MDKLKGKHYVFTLNNPNDWNTPEGFLDRLWETGFFDYICMGKETAASGTKHFQGYFKCNKDERVTALKKHLPQAHFEKKRGTVQQAVDYCKKEGCFFYRGVMPLEQAAKGAETVKVNWEEVRSLAKKGKLDDIEARVFVQNYTTLKTIARDFMPQAGDINGVCGVWLWGDSGCGKTQYTRTKFPGLYPKQMNKWWCGYQEEEVVVLDDVDPSHHSWLGHFLKIWGDSVSFIAEQKLGAKSIRPKLFIVTSQYEIEGIFTDTETRAALNRRYISIKFTNSAGVSAKIAPRLTRLTVTQEAPEEDILLEDDLLSLPDFI